MVEVHKVHNKDNPVHKFYFDIELDRWTACEKNNIGTSALVFDMSFIKDKKHDFAITFDNNLDPNNKTASNKDIPMHSDRLKLDLWVLWHAWFNWIDHRDENDGWNQGRKRIRQGVLRTWVGFQYVLKAILRAKDSQNTKTVLDHNPGICTVRE